MSRRSTFPLADRIFKGNLLGYLQGLKDAGLSHEDIAFKLREEHQLEVSASTVRNWLNGQR